MWSVYKYYYLILIIQSNIIYWMVENITMYHLQYN